MVSYGSFSFAVWYSVCTFVYTSFDSVRHWSVSRSFLSSSTDCSAICFWFFFNALHFSEICSSCFNCSSVSANVCPRFCIIFFQLVLNPSSGASFMFIWSVWQISCAAWYPARHSRNAATFISLVFSFLSLSSFADSTSACVGASSLNNVIWGCSLEPQTGQGCPASSVKASIPACSFRNFWYFISYSAQACS